jgi:hypothetical protein
VGQLLARGFHLTDKDIKITVAAGVTAFDKIALYLDL